MLKLSKVYKTNTDYYTCVFITPSMSMVTVYDIVTEKHERKGTFAAHAEACEFAEYLAKQYTI